MLSWVGGYVCVDQEPIVQHDVMDGVQFFFVFIILQVVRFEEYGIMLSVKSSALNTKPWATNLRV